MSTLEAATICKIYKPFVYIKFHNINLNDEIFENYTKKYLELLIECKKNKEKIYVIIDINEFESLPIPYLLKQAQFNKKIFNYNQKYLHCVYIYCKNKLFKQMIKMYMMVEKTAVPLTIFRSLTKLNSSIKEKWNIDFDSHIFFKNNFKQFKQESESSFEEDIDYENNEIDNKNLEEFDNLHNTIKLLSYQENINLNSSYKDYFSNLEN